MRSQKTETLTVRLAPDIKAALREAAAQEHRSLANMLEVMIRSYTADPRSVSTLLGERTGSHADR